MHHYTWPLFFSLKKITKLITFRLAFPVHPDQTCASSPQLSLVHSKSAPYSTAGNSTTYQDALLYGKISFVIPTTDRTIQPFYSSPREYQQLLLWPCASHRTYEACVHLPLWWVSDSWWPERRYSATSWLSWQPRKHPENELSLFINEPTP